MIARSTILLFVALLVGASVTKEVVDFRVKERLVQGNVRRLPTPQTSSILAMGYKSALADIFWIEAINYFGLELTSKNRTYKFLPAYCENIFALDPLFTVFYDWAATAFIYNSMKVTKDNMRHSVRFVTLGIRELFKVHRFNSQLLVKGAFNYALELQEFKKSLPYFALAGNSFWDQRNMLLVGSTYATYSQEHELASEFKLQYLTHIFLQALDASETKEALNILSSPRFNVGAVRFLQSLRLRMEKDEAMKKLVLERIQQNPTQAIAMKSKRQLAEDPRIENVLEIDLSRNWLKPEMHILFSL